MNDIVVITPTYNRMNEICNLYDSLLIQSYKNFEWLIIDDGSTDLTHEYVDTIQKEGLVKISYIKIENGGKGRALNYAFNLITSRKLCAIVDSDDLLKKDSIEIFKFYLDEYYNDLNVGAFFFYYENQNGQLIKPDGILLNDDITLNRYQYNRKYKLNDGCICYLDRAIKKYRYPEFDKEKYVGPTVIQMEMAKEFDIVFSPKVVGVAEYKTSGLTQQGRKLRLKNPLSMLYYTGLMQSRENSLFIRLKNMIGSQAYRFFSKKSIHQLNTYKLDVYLKKWAFLPGYMLYLFWKWKNE